MALPGAFPLDVDCLVFYSPLTVSVKGMSLAFFLAHVAVLPRKGPLLASTITTNAKGCFSKFEKKFLFFDKESLCTTLVDMVGSFTRCLSASYFVEKKEAVIPLAGQQPLFCNMSFSRNVLRYFMAIILSFGIGIIYHSVLTKL